MTLPLPAPGHVARFVEPGDATRPPDLPVTPSLRRGSAIAIGVLLVCAVAVGAALIATLWIEPTPGWWFSALFSVFIAALLVAAWAMLLVSIRDGRERNTARAQWEGIEGRARAVGGLITAREVSIREDGMVSAFEVVVALDDNAVVRGVWGGSGSQPKNLLQPQIPVVGQRVTVWRAADAPAEWPHVVDVTDPSDRRRQPRADGPGVGRAS